MNTNLRLSTIAVVVVCSVPFVSSRCLGDIVEPFSKGYASAYYDHAKSEEYDGPALGGSATAEVNDGYSGWGEHGSVYASFWNIGNSLHAKAAVSQTTFVQGGQALAYGEHFETAALDFTNARIAPSEVKYTSLLYSLDGTLYASPEDNRNFAHVRFSLKYPMFDPSIPYIWYPGPVKELLVEKSVDSSTGPFADIDLPMVPKLLLFDTGDPNVKFTWFWQSLEVDASGATAVADFSNTATLKTILLPDGHTPQFYGIDVSFGSGASVPGEISTPVPEPSALAIWAMLGLGGAGIRSRGLRWHGR